MDIINRKEKVKKLNTKGCFLCLRNNNHKTDFNESKVNEVETFKSIRDLLAYLRISSNSANGTSLFDEAQAIEVNLCKSCGKINTDLSDLLQKLEKIQMEVDSVLEQIHTRISNSASSVNNSRRITSDPEALSHEGVVDKLRNEIAEKSLKMRRRPSPSIKLDRVNIKTEVLDNEEIEDPSEMDCDPPPTPSLPDSPLTPPSDMTSDEESSSDDQQGPSTPKEHTPFQVKLYYEKNETTGMLHCKKCDEQYKTVSGLRWHYQGVHLKMRFKCDICNELRDISNISSHRRKCKTNFEKRQAQEKDPKFKYLCPYCDKRFDTCKKLCDHRRGVHHNTDRYPCKLCDKKFKQQYQLRVHVDTVHLGVEYSCGFCNKTNRSIKHIMRHEKTCEKRGTVKSEPEDN